MSLSHLTVKDLFNAGVHYGHRRARSNPAMNPYLFGEYNRIKIIDLDKTLPCLDVAAKAMSQCVRNGGRVLFVGTKIQARDSLKEAAEKSGQYHMVHRWLGGTLTNWHTISNSLKNLRTLEALIVSPEFQSYTKKEQSKFKIELEKYERILGGIKNMGARPDMLFIIDIFRENTALREARALNIPVIAVCDSNTDPSLVTYPIPGNDDSLKAIDLYCKVMTQAALSGLKEEMELARNNAKPKSKDQDKENPVQSQEQKKEESVQ